MSHICEAIDFKNQGRCKHCGKFMSKQQNIKSSIITKDELIDLLRKELVEIDHIKYGKFVNDIVTLQSQYLTNHIGKGSSKKTDNDTVFAYDINLKKFISIKVSTIDGYAILEYN